MARTLPPDEARAYLNAKFDQITRAVVDRDYDAATGVIAQMRADGFGPAADDAFDGLIEVKRLADEAAAKAAKTD